ncbi:MAG: hypothetical protein AAFW98_15185, partial [Pseudomonadota bacterium]
MLSHGGPAGATPPPSRTGRRSGRIRQRLSRAVPLVLITAAILIVGLALRLQDPAALNQLRNLVFDEY